MLTAFQCEVVAFQSEYGDLFCYDCAHAMLNEGALPSVEPVIRYSLDEYQEQQGYEYCGEEEAPWGEGSTECACAPEILCDECGTELVEAYYDAYFHEKED